VFGSAGAALLLERLASLVTVGAAVGAAETGRVGIESSEAVLGRSSSGAISDDASAAGGVSVVTSEVTELAEFAVEATVSAGGAAGTAMSAIAAEDSLGAVPIDRLTILSQGRFSTSGMLTDETDEGVLKSREAEVDGGGTDCSGESGEMLGRSAAAISAVPSTGIVELFAAEATVVLAEFVAATTFSLG